MTEPNLERLLEKLKSINVLTQKAIDELANFLEKNELDVLSRTSFAKNIYPHIVSVNEEADFLRSFKFDEPNSNPKSTEVSDLHSSTEDALINENINGGGEQSSENVNNEYEISSGCSPDASANNEPDSIDDSVKECTNEGSEQLLNNLDQMPEETSTDAPNNIKPSSELEMKELKPLLKIVDFSKLVDPRNLELMNKNENRKLLTDESVIILSSSDDETISKQNNKVLSKSPVSVSLISKEKGIISKKSDSLISSDVKFQSKPYVKLIKVPIERMKEYYSIGTANRSNDGNSSSGSADEPISKYLKQKTLSHSRRTSEMESEATEDVKKRRRKKKIKKSIKSNSDSSSDDENDKVEVTSDCSSQKKSNSDKTDLDRTHNLGDVSPALSSKEKQESKEGSVCNSESNLETSEKLQEPQSSNDDAKVKQNEEENSNKDIVISSNNSDDSDVDTFFKKNKFVKNRKRIESSSDSDGVKIEERKPQNNESDKEISVCDNSDKEEDIINKKKRKRIKKLDDNSSGSDEGTTRKKIKKLISKDSLSDHTKKATAEEKERKQRILEKQKKYNQIYEDLNLANSKVEKLVLDVDEETGKPLLEVDQQLVSKLKPHQASGIQFMWDACFESLEMIRKSKGSGCILAHCMGLGKTLQVIALVHTLLESDETKVKKVLIVTPLSTVLNWKAEFQNWLSGEESFQVYELVSLRAQNADRACCIREWHEVGGVMIMSYAMFRNLSNDKNRKVSKKFRTIFVEGLVDPGPDLVVCDEGHLLKNEKTSLSIAMNKIKTRRRIVLTGTPLQNNLKEYYCMVQFVKPNLLGTYKEYMNRFVNPITNGQYTDSTQYDINIMRRRAHVLHKLLDGIVQRRDYSVLSPYLPPKYEYVLFLTLTDVQKKLYKHYMDHFAKKSSDEGSNKTSYLFKDFQAFSRICIHPRVLLDKSIDDQQKYQSDEESMGSMKDFIDDGDESTSTPNSSESESDTDNKKKRGTKIITRAQKKNCNVESESEDEVVEKEWWQEYCDDEELDNIAHSTKLMILFEILKECEEIGDKVLLFSQSLYALNLIEYFLEKVDEATQNGNTDKKTCGYSGSWCQGLDYFRLDGSTNCGLRSEWCESFNNERNSRARLFLLSTKAGGLGINLVAANRVILFDVSWNPSSDVQSIYRVYRFGQLKPSYIYRFVTFGTMEMKIYERQVTKQAISKRVIDEQQIDRHYNSSDLQELYKFEEPEMEVRPTPLVPKDILLGEMLQNHDDKIYTYHEHQSLLENKEDETLNEEERKAAWDEFENEKVERTKQAFIGKFSINTIQLAMKNIIQRDNPTWNNNQILSIIPQLIQQLNLQLSLGDQTMYKRIAAEIQLIQDEYNRKRQLEFYQYQLQKAAQNQPYHMLQQAMANRLAVPGVSAHPNPAFNMNPNEVLELN